MRCSKYAANTDVYRSWMIMDDHASPKLGYFNWTRWQLGVAHGFIPFQRSITIMTEKLRISRVLVQTEVFGECQAQQMGFMIVKMVCWISKVNMGGSGRHRKTSALIGSKLPGFSWFSAPFVLIVRDLRARKKGFRRRLPWCMTGRSTLGSMF